MPGFETSRDRSLRREALLLWRRTRPCGPGGWHACHDGDYDLDDLEDLDDHEDFENLDDLEDLEDLEDHERGESILHQQEEEDEDLAATVLQAGVKQLQVQKEISLQLNKDGNMMDKEEAFEDSEMGQTSQASEENEMVKIENEMTKLHPICSN